MDSGPYRYCWADALVIKVREQRRTQRVHVLIATGVNAEGHREILGIDVNSEESGAGWLAFFRELVAAGSPVSVSSPPTPTKVSSAPSGRRFRELVGSRVARTTYGTSCKRSRSPPSRGWRRSCGRSSTSPTQHRSPPSSTGSLRPLRTSCPRPLRTSTMHVTICSRSRHSRELWRQCWSNNPQERLNREIRRRTDVVGTFPDRPSVIRLIGAVLAEQHDEWSEQRRYMGLELLAKTDAVGILSETNGEEVMLPATVVA